MPEQIVDQRSEPRLAPPLHTAAQLCVLRGVEKSAPVSARVFNFSGRGMRIGLPEALAAGTLVRLDLEETMILAEVCYSEPDGDGGFAMGLRLEHSLLQTSGLERLRQRFAEEDFREVGEQRVRAIR